MADSLLCLSVRETYHSIWSRKKKVLFPGGWQLARGLVVTGETVDTGFNENQSEFRVLVLSVTFQVFSDSNGFLDQMV